MSIKIALTNLGKYNEGELNYSWLELPASQEEIDAAFEKIGVADDTEYEEYFITDYETDIEGLEIGEYENLDDLNELAERLEELDDIDRDTLQAVLEWQGGDISDIIDSLDNYCLYPNIQSNEDLGNYWIFESGCYEVPENLQYYIDCEKFGRDLAMEGNGFMSSYGWIEEH